MSIFMFGAAAAFANDATISSEGLLADSVVVADSSGDTTNIQPSEFSIINSINGSTTYMGAGSISLSDGSGNLIQIFPSETGVEVDGGGGASVIGGGGISTGSLSTSTLAADSISTTAISTNSIDVTGEYANTSINSYGLSSTSSANGSSIGLGPGSISISDGSGNLIQIFPSETGVEADAVDGQASTMSGDGISTPFLSTTFLTADSVIAASFVSTPKWKVPDYVFEKGYHARSLKELEGYVTENKHLPEIPSAAQMQKGVDVGEMNLRLLKTVEELTLNVIDMNKEIQLQEEKSASLEKKISRLTHSNP